MKTIFLTPAVASVCLSISVSSPYLLICALVVTTIPSSTFSSSASTASSPPHGVVSSALGPQCTNVQRSREEQDSGTTGQLCSKAWLSTAECIRSAKCVCRDRVQMCPWWHCQSWEELFQHVASLN